MDFSSLLDAVMQLEREVTEMRPGDPRLAEVGGRIDEIEYEVESARGMARPLVPDAGGPESTADATADNLERALAALRSAVASKR